MTGGGTRKFAALVAPRKKINFDFIFYGVQPAMKISQEAPNSPFKAPDE